MQMNTKNKRVKILVILLKACSTFMILAKDTYMINLLLKIFSNEILNLGMKIDYSDNVQNCDMW